VLENFVGWKVLESLLGHFWIASFCQCAL
jgi:hypothetical protein